MKNGKIKRAIFKYPDSKTGAVMERDVFVLEFNPEDSVKGISLTDCPDRAAILETAEKLNSLIANNMKYFRNFKLAKVIKE